MNYNYVVTRRLKKTNRNQLKRIMFYILISLTIIQQMPVIKDLFYGQMRLYLYISFGLFSVVSFFHINRFFKINFVRYFIFTVAYVLILFIIIKIINNELADIFEIIIPFGILFCSLNTHFDKRRLSNFMIWYTLLSVTLGLGSIFYYGDGFIIPRSYFLTGKNQIGPLLGVSAIIVGMWNINSSQFDLRYNSKIAKMGIFILLVLPVAVIRNRSGLVGVVFTLLFLIAEEYRPRNTIKNILIFMVVLLILIVLFFGRMFNELINAIYKTLFLNYDIHDLNSISAGRIGTYILSLEFIMQNLTLGELVTGGVIGSTSHNYILNKWVRFGLVGSFPIVLFYLYLWCFVFKAIFMNGNRDKTHFSLPIWVLLFSLIVSLFEYTYPYGPGVSQVMVWFLLGQYFRFNHIVNCNIN